MNLRNKRTNTKRLQAVGVAVLLEGKEWTQKDLFDKNDTLLWLLYPPGKEPLVPMQ
jgi:hypothetical protein